MLSSNFRGKVINDSTGKGARRRSALKSESTRTQVSKSADKTTDPKEASADLPRAACVRYVSNGGGTGALALHIIFRSEDEVHKHKDSRGEVPCTNNCRTCNS